ncbi:MAG: XdhC family protein [Fimbriimonadia bacterium]|jgi:xanthine dehydrogenase accessory factor
MTTLEWAEKLLAEGLEFCLGVVVAKSGSAPQQPGAKGLFLADGRVIGTLGGGCLEAECRRLALDAMRSGKHVYREFSMDDDFGWDDGLICGGRVQVLLLPRPETFASALRAANQARAEGKVGVLVYELTGTRGGSVEWDPTTASDSGRRALHARREVLADEGGRRVFVEPVVPPDRLIVFGAGHIGAMICEWAAKCDFQVTVVDDRPTFAHRERLPSAHDIVVELPEVAASSLPIDEHTYLCIVTRGHRNDASVLRAVIHSPAAYIGMIGSRRKVAVMRREFVAQGVCSEDIFDRVRSPMGLPIGAETVTEIAISILAELLQTRASLRGPLLARCGPKPLSTAT